MGEQHDCIQVGVIATMQNQIKNIMELDKIDREENNVWKERIEGKIDKIIWFFFGQSVTVLLGLISATIIGRMM